MGVREFVNRKRGAAVGIGVGLFVLAIAFVAYNSRGGGAGGGVVPRSGYQAWFTDDDGKSVFADDLNKMAPFDHNGKKAVRAYCFTTDGGKTHFVAYLERFTDAAKKKLEPLPGEKRDPTALEALGIEVTEVKAPGAPESEWVSHKAGAKYTKVMQVKPPTGQIDQLEQYLP